MHMQGCSYLTAFSGALLIDCRFCRVSTDLIEVDFEDMLVLVSLTHVRLQGKAYIFDVGLSIIILLTVLIL